MSEYEGKCPNCGSSRWVSVSLDGGWTRRPQCVPCGAIHRAVLGRGTADPRGATWDAHGQALTPPDEPSSSPVRSADKGTD